MIIPIAIVFGVLGLYLLSRPAGAGEWNPERAAVYDYNIRYERDPTKLKHWADFFSKQGFPQQSASLRARMNVPRVHGEGRALRADMVRRAFRSQNCDAIRELASGFECDGRGSTAEMLRLYARGIELNRDIEPVYNYGIPGGAPLDIPVDDPTDPDQQKFVYP